jgi:hypothetical protein
MNHRQAFFMSLLSDWSRVVAERQRTFEQGTKRVSGQSTVAGILCCILDQGLDTRALGGRKEALGARQCQIYCLQPYVVTANGRTKIFSP